MMTKLEISMQNNELEAKVIELESQLHTLQEEIEAGERLHEAECKELAGERDKAEDETETLEKVVASLLISRPAERFDDWYKRLHPTHGSDPDLRVARQP